jgi:hypothetical protein
MEGKGTRFKQAKSGADTNSRESPNNQIQYNPIDQLLARGEFQFQMKTTNFPTNLTPSDSSGDCSTLS